MSANLVIKHRTARMEGVEGVGVYLRYKHDRKLLGRYTRDADEMKVSVSLLMMLHFEQQLHVEQIRP